MSLILFGSKALKEENDNLRVSNENLIERNLELERENAEVDNRIERVRISNIREMDELKNVHEREINRLTDQIADFDASFERKVEAAVAEKKKELKKLTETQERDFKDRVKKLDKEYEDREKKLNKEFTDRMNSNDRKLEQDKISYRKYLRQEHNTRLTELEKENKNLSKENMSLNSEVKAQENTIGILQGQVKVLSGNTETFAKSLDSLSSKLGDGLVKAMPNISADFSTPKNPETHVHIEQPTGKGGGNQGGNKEGK